MVSSAEFFVLELRIAGAPKTVDAAVARSVVVLTVTNFRRANFELFEERVVIFLAFWRRSTFGRRAFQGAGIVNRNAFIFQCLPSNVTQSANFWRPLV